MRSFRSFTLIAFIACSLFAGRPADAAQFDTVLVSRTGAYGDSGSAGSFVPSDRSLSADGRYVVVRTAASFDPEDADVTNDIYVRDVVAKTMTLASRADGELGAKGSGASQSASISADGRFVAFRSSSNNLDPDDLDATADVFVRDLVGDTTTLVSRETDRDGAKGTAAASGTPVISEDGRFVAFTTAAPLDPANDADAFDDVYVRDQELGTTTLASREDGPSGAKSGAASSAPAMSADGHTVAFFTPWGLDPALDLDSSSDVYTRDIVANTTTLVSRWTDGAKSNGSATVPSISGDGNLVAFQTIASNFDPMDTGADLDIYVRDLSAGTTTLVSRGDGLSGAEANGSSSTPSISLDGRFVGFDSTASNLPGDPDVGDDVFVRDLANATTTLVDRASGETGVKVPASHRAALSGDGRFIAFDSTDSSFDPADTNTAADVFVRDVFGPQPPPALTIGDVRMREGRSGTKAFIFRVTLDPLSGRTVSVEYATASGTATRANNDYQFRNGVLTFAPGESTKTVTVNVVGDRRREPSETFKVKLFNANGAGVDDPLGIGTIVNDDR